MYWKIYNISFVVYRESSLADILEGIPPTFSRKPKAKIVNQGSDIELECRLVAVPEPEITWLFNNKEVKTSDTVTVSTQSDMHMYSTVLQIKKVENNQEGTYTVVAKNREGQATVNIVLKVVIIFNIHSHILQVW